ncbi:hypothetical protein BX661DRAFT_63780 [Kickxella alabastrina]|uniref:uncharacterized protein n=1 Tax=Kickxella alabastrina TaxID=61397 RepID=UPI00221F2C42|nr:uncharacterized protein BX661DRAFT_63780 [Kickxella alabastrina]KAI7833658.1 hypothetical protein BX661DRAFT_63780 [Kickxella alabastrina]
MEYIELCESCVPCIVAVALLHAIMCSFLHLIIRQPTSLSVKGACSKPQLLLLLLILLFLVRPFNSPPLLFSFAVFT